MRVRAHTHMLGIVYYIEKLESILVMGSECGNKSRPTEIKHSFSRSLETFPKYRNAIFLPACLLAYLPELRTPDTIVRVSERGSERGVTHIRWQNNKHNIHAHTRLRQTNGS